MTELIHKGITKNCVKSTKTYFGTVQKDQPKIYWFSLNNSLLVEQTYSSPGGTDRKRGFHLVTIFTCTG